MNNLTEKYRPIKLSDILAKHQTKTAVESVANTIHNIPVVILFGPSGYGKTTIARIFASIVLNNNINDFNFKEINAADQRGIDDTRNIVSFISSTSLFAQGKKVVILNEAHQLTETAQNCLLAPMEDNPHSCFIFTTTDPDKIIKTIKTRAVTIQIVPFNVTNDANDFRDVKEYLHKILAKENYLIHEDLLGAIVHSEPNSIRQFLLKLQLIMSSDIHDLSMDAKHIISSIADVEKTSAIDLARLIVDTRFFSKTEHKLAHWSNISNKIRNCSANPESVRRTIVAYINAVILNSFSKTKLPKIADEETNNFFRQVKTLEIMSSKSNISKEELTTMLIRSLFLETEVKECGCQGSKKMLENKNFI